MTYAHVEAWLRLPTAGRHRLAGLATPVTDVFKRWLDRRQSARRLARLPDRLLNDIGIKRSEIRMMMRGAGRETC